MTDADDVPSRWKRGWTYVQRYWHWPVLVVVGIYVYQQYMPSIALENRRSAPPVVAETVNGETFRMRDHKGEVVVVNVWATWCGPCRVEMPGFVELQEEFRDEGVQFVGIAVDQNGARVVRRFVEDEGINFPQIVDPRLAARHFPGTAVPRTYLIGKQGRIRYKHSGIILKWALDDALERLVNEPAG